MVTKYVNLIFLCCVLIDKIVVSDAKPFLFNSGNSIVRLLSSSSISANSNNEDDIESNISDYTKLPSVRENEISHSEPTMLDRSNFIRNNVEIVLEKLRESLTNQNERPLTVFARSFLSPALFPERKLVDIEEEDDQGKLELAEEFTAVDNQTSHESNDTREPLDLDVEVLMKKERKPAKFILRVIEQLTANATDEDSWEEFDEEDEMDDKKKPIRFDPSSVGYFILEVVGSLIGLALGAVGQISMGINNFRNNTTS